MSAAPLLCLVPDWPSPPGVRALSTLRQGGASVGALHSLNFGTAVDDSLDALAENRRRLTAAAGLPAAPRWLKQVHGRALADLDTQPDSDVPVADAAVTRRPGVVCALLTADCLPVLLARRDGTAVAAAHAGWRGLAAGVIEAAFDALASPGSQVQAWLGPAIGPAYFEVGDEVRDAMVAADPGAQEAFIRNDRRRWQCDLYQLARRRLVARGVEAVFGGEHCTFAEVDRFYSHRRDQGRTGRMATLIWRETL